MSRFRYRVVASGREFSGRRAADSEEQLRSTLASEGYTIVEVAPIFELFGPGSVSTSSLILFTRQLRNLLHSGLSVVKALDILFDQLEDERMREAVLTMLRAIETGTTVPDAFERHPEIFDRLYMASIRAGVRSGQLEPVLDGLVEHLKKVKELSGKFLGAMIYPAVLLAIASGLVLVMLVFAVPNLKGLIAEGGRELPLITQIVFAASDALAAYPAALFAGILTAIAAAVAAVRSTAGRAAIDRFSLMLPYLGDLVRKYALFHFTKTLASLLGSGVSLVESLRVSLPSISNRHVRVLFEPVIGDVENGIPLADSVEKHGAAPQLLIKLMRVGYGAGDLETMLKSAAEIYAEEVEGALSILAAVVEPLMIAMMGLVIGTIILAIMQPMLQMMGNVQG